MKNHPKLLPTTESDNAIIRPLGRQDYHSLWEQMKAFTRSRDSQTRDEIWVLEHPPVYTAGIRCHQAARPPPGDIPLIYTDRGGELTYHGPGQLVAYMLFDIKRMNSGPRGLVRALETLGLRFLARYGIHGTTRSGAPGIYVRARKIAAIGLKISRGCSYHGLSLNIDMDLAPFSNIIPCGDPTLKMTRLSDCVEGIRLPEATAEFIDVCATVPAPWRP